MANMIHRAVIFFAINGSLGLSASAVASCGEGCRGVVVSASPEASELGSQVLRHGGNAIDAAIAVSLGLTVSEPAGSSIAAQGVMLIRSPEGKSFVLLGIARSPRQIPVKVEGRQLRSGYTSVAVPSLLKVLDKAHQQFGSGELSWRQLVTPVARLAREGFIVGPFREKSFLAYRKNIEHESIAPLMKTSTGSFYTSGDRLPQPALSRTLETLAVNGAEDFYRGEIAQSIVNDLAKNGGWLTAEDLSNAPSPEIVAPVSADYRGYRIESLPPPFGGWVVLQALKLLEREKPGMLEADDDHRRSALLNALRIVHTERLRVPLLPGESATEHLSDKFIDTLSNEKETGGETTHFVVADAEGWVVSMTQSINSYYGAGVANTELGFIYNNYLSGFRLREDAGVRLFREDAPIQSSMSATLVLKNGQAVMALGSPGSARIISAVTQVASYWIDIEPDISKAVSAYRVHALRPDRAFVEGPEVSLGLLIDLSKAGFRLRKPMTGTANGQLDPYFGGVHAIARQDGHWVGAADPRRDGMAVYAVEEDGQ